MAGTIKYWFPREVNMINEKSNEQKKVRLVQEYVPGKQVTLAHVIRHPRSELSDSLGIEEIGAVGIMTITPGEGSVIAADIASKAASVHIEFVDRFTGCLMVTGTIADVETSLDATVKGLQTVLGFYPCEITST